MITAAKLVRGAGVFALNMLIALVVTEVVVFPFKHFNVETRRESILREDFLSSVAAFGLGYVVFRRWRTSSSKWVCLAGLCWFGWGAIQAWIAQQAAASVLYRSHVDLWRMSGMGCYDFASCRDWLDYTLPLLRTVLYSAGAFSYAWLGKYESAALPGLKKAILSLRRQ
ncbi:MAG: hypothetical protein LAP38_10975 [Acidobacteriia bacterium]|nr:hypothetical protein [Terriglobia bacterium]